MSLPDSAKELIESGSLAHLVTLNADGSPQVTCVWVGLDGDELVSGHLAAGQRKLQKPMDDPPPGYIMRTTVERIGGVGPWAS
jgi:hypothetical protein